MTDRKLVQVVGAAIVEGDKCLIARRAQGHNQAGRWEFPGGKVEPRERPRAALAREIREELGLDLVVGDRLGRGEIGPIQLTVYRAARKRGEIRLVDHDAIAWITADEIDGYSFADADVPILPALETLLRPECEPSPNGVHWIGIDWSSRGNHRSAVAAIYDDGRYRIDALAQPVTREPFWTVATLTEAASRIADSTSRACLVGVDVSLGIPYALGKRVDQTFAEYVTSLSDAAFASATTSADEWTPARPFFSIPKGRGSRRRFIDAAGGDGMLRRQLEIATHAKETFAVSGIPGVVGAATRDFWQEMRTGWGRDFAVWPFDGPMDELLRRFAVVFAEAYPRLVYRVANERILPAAMAPLAKTKPEVRRSVVAALPERASAWSTIAPSLKAQMCASEDDFDAAMLAIGLARIGFEGRPLAAHVIDRRYEGALLASSAVDVMAD